MGIDDGSLMESSVIHYAYNSHTHETINSIKQEQSENNTSDRLLYLSKAGESCFGSGTTIVYFNIGYCSDYMKRDCFAVPYIIISIVGFYTLHT